MFCHEMNQALNKLSVEDKLNQLFKGKLKDKGGKMLLLMHNVSVT